MNIRITDEAMISGTTPHSADAEGDGWTVTWLPGRGLDRATRPGSARSWPPRWTSSLSSAGSSPRPVTRRGRRSPDRGSPRRDAAQLEQARAETVGCAAARYAAELGTTEARAAAAEAITEMETQARARQQAEELARGAARELDGQRAAAAAAIAAAEDAPARNGGASRTGSSTPPDSPPPLPGSPLRTCSWQMTPCPMCGGR